MKQPTHSKETHVKTDEQYAQKLTQFSSISVDNKDLFAQTLSNLTVRDDAVHTRHMLDVASSGSTNTSHQPKRAGILGSMKIYASLGAIALIFLVGGFVLLRNDSGGQVADVTTQSSSIVADGSVANATSAIAATIQEEVSLSNAVFASSTTALDQIKSQTETLSEVSNDSSF